MLKRFKHWKEWRKNNLNSKWHQWMVLLGLRHSPTFMNYCVFQDIWEEYKHDQN